MGIPTYNNPVDCSDVPEKGGEKKLTYVINGHDYDIDPIDYMVGPVTRMKPNMFNPTSPNFLAAALFGLLPKRSKSIKKVIRLQENPLF